MYKDISFLYSVQFHWRPANSFLCYWCISSSKPLFPLVFPKHILYSIQLLFKSSALAVISDIVDVYSIQLLFKSSALAVISDVVDVCSIQLLFKSSALAVISDVVDVYSIQLLFKSSALAVISDVVDVYSIQLLFKSSALAVISDVVDVWRKQGFPNLFSTVIPEARPVLCPVTVKSPLR